MRKSRQGQSSHTLKGILKWFPFTKSAAQIDEIDESLINNSILFSTKDLPKNLVTKFENG